jgi:hypothetical protein
MDLATLREFEDVVRKLVPGFRIAYKDETPFQKLLGFFARPFNNGYMSRYTTTFYPVVYFPSKTDYETNIRGSFVVLAHEFIHLLDSAKHPVWFRLSYSLPQILSPLVLTLYSFLGHSPWPGIVSLAGLVVSLFLALISPVAFAIGAGATVIAASILAVFITKWWAILFFVGLAILAPWPSPGRVWAEHRGYAMNLAINQWMSGTVVLLQKELTVRYFTGPNYYFMSWRRPPHDAWVADILTRAKNGGLAKEPGYSVVYEFLKAKGLLYNG